MNLCPAASCSGDSFPCLSLTQLSHNQILTRQVQARRPRAGGNPSNKEGKCKQTELVSPKQCQDVNRMLPKPSLGAPESSLLPLFSAMGLGNLIAQSWDVTSGGTQVPAVFQKWKKTQHSLKVKSQKESGRFHTQIKATAGQHLLFAISSPLQQRETHRNPLHTPGFFKGVFLPDLPPLLSNYTNLNFLPGCVFSVFHCASIVLNCLLVSGKQLHFPHHWHYVKGAETTQSLWSFTSQRGAHWFNYKSLHCAESSEFLQTTTSSF